MTPDQIIQMLSQGQYPQLPQQNIQGSPDLVSMGKLMNQREGIAAPQSTQADPAMQWYGQHQLQARQQGSPQLIQTGKQQLAANQNASQQSAGMINHVVQPGDTLWGIAHHYTGSGDNWSKLGGFNFHQDPRTLKVGSTIQIPQALASKQQNIGKAPSNIASSGGGMG